MLKTRARRPRLAAGLAACLAAIGAASHAADGAADRPADHASEPVCCAFEASLRVVSDAIHAADTPLLAPAIRGSQAHASQARMELSAQGPDEQHDALWNWRLRGYVRTDQPLTLRNTESPALLKLRQATLSVPIVDGELTLGRIVTGSGTMRLRNLVDYLDTISVQTERRSDFLPERLDNRIGQDGAQLSQLVAGGALRWLLVPKINGPSDHEGARNNGALSLLRFAPDLAGSAASLEGLWFWSRQRSALGAHGTLPVSSGVQFYGEISHEWHWPQLRSTAAGPQVDRVTATLSGVGFEYRPHSDWNLALEAFHNSRPIERDALARAQHTIEQVAVRDPLISASLLGGLPFGFQQAWYAGALLQVQPVGSKFNLALSHYQGLAGGSSVHTVQAKLGMGKHAEVSLFARKVRSRAGQEFGYTPESSRRGLAFNWAF
jgi:hypothetical protein